MLSERVPEMACQLLPSASTPGFRQFTDSLSSDAGTLVPTSPITEQDFPVSQANPTRCRPVQRVTPLRSEGGRRNDGPRSRISCHGKAEAPASRYDHIHDKGGALYKPCCCLYRQVVLRRIWPSIANAPH